MRNFLHHTKEEIFIPNWHEEVGIDYLCAFVWGFHKWNQARIRDIQKLELIFSKNIF